MIIAQTGYDRRNGVYLAYNTGIKIFATGVCVNTAIENFHKERITNIKNRIAAQGRISHLEQELAEAENDFKEYLLNR